MSIPPPEKSRIVRQLALLEDALEMGSASSGVLILYLNPLATVVVDVNFTSSFALISSATSKESKKAWLAELNEMTPGQAPLSIQLLSIFSGNLGTHLQLIPTPKSHACVISSNLGSIVFLIEKLCDAYGIDKAWVDETRLALIRETVGSIPESSVRPRQKSVL